MKKFYISAIVIASLNTSFAQVTIENTIENLQIKELSTKMIGEVNLLNSGMLTVLEKDVFELKLKSDAVVLFQSFARYEEGKSVRELTDKLEFDFVVDGDGHIRETTTGLDVQSFILNSDGNLVSTTLRNIREIAIDELNIDIREMTTGMDVEYRLANPSGGVTEIATISEKFLASENVMGQAVSNLVQKLSSNNLSADVLVSILQELIIINQETQKIGVLSKNVGAVPKAQLAAKL